MAANLSASVLPIELSTILLHHIELFWQTVPCCLSSISSHGGPLSPTKLCCNTFRLTAPSACSPMK